MPENFYMLFLVALIPMFVGAAYYHPKLVGGAWMKTNGLTEEYLAKGNMVLIFGLAYVFSLMMTTMLSSLVIHQTSIVGLMVPEIFEPGSQILQDVQAFMAKYGDRHRTWTHGAAHGLITSLFLVLPLISIIALFERRGWKYVLIHFGYWTISLIAMGAVLCETLVYKAL